MYFGLRKMASTLLRGWLLGAAGLVAGAGVLRYRRRAGSAAYDDRTGVLS